MDTNSQIFSIEQHVKEKTTNVNSPDDVGKTIFSVANGTTLPKEDISKLNLNEQLWTIHIFGKFQISITKPLIPLRIALFLWYGAASSPVAYLSVFMKQKGLSLVEYSSIFSVTFVFQFLTAFVSGLVADKIGNAKPVLLFHILMTILMTLTLLLTPGTNSCGSFSKYNFSSYDESDISNITGENKDINETFQNVSTNLGHFDEFDIFNYTNFTKYSLQTVTDFSSTDGNVNFTAVNAEYSPNSCESRGKIFLIIHIIAIFVYFSSWSAVYRFMDVTVMSLTEKYNTSFGFERFFSITGNVIVTFLTGIVLYSFTSAGEQNNYRSVYWFSLTITCLVLVAVYCIKPQIKLPSQNLWNQIFSLIRNLHVVVFFLVVFSLGTFHCFFDHFVLWILEHLNASTVVMGLQQAMNGLYGLPFFLTSKWWLKIFDTEKLFIGAYLGYIIYGVGYSFLIDPWLCLLVESASVLIYHILWVAVIVHSHRIAPAELVSTVIATAGAVHFGIGRSSGVTIGGLLMNEVGPRIAFRIFSGASCIAAILHASYLYFRSSKGKCRK